MVDQPEQRNNPAGPRRAALSGRTIVSGLLLIPAIAVLMPSCILVGIGMVPAFVAFIVDRTQEKYLALTVGLLNVSATLPGLMTLWSRGQTYEAALTIAIDPSTMLITYGAAGIAWAIYLALPLILAHYFAVATETRLAMLRRRQQALVEQWGEEISGAQPGGEG